MTNVTFSASFRSGQIVLDRNHGDHVGRQRFTDVEAGRASAALLKVATKAIAISAIQEALAAHDLTPADVFRSREPRPSCDLVAAG